MDQFLELDNLISAVLTKSDSPIVLGTLAKEVNGILGSRALPESAIRAFLMRNRDRFMEVRPGEWTMGDKRPRSRGVRRVDRDAPRDPDDTPAGEMGPLKPLRESLPQLAQATLDHLVPTTADKPTLDPLSVFHIAQSTFRSNCLPRDATDTNILVPAKLHEQTRNLAWRFPPMLETTFFVKSHSQEKPSLDMRVVFGVASLLEYQEWRAFGETGRVQRRYVSQPEINTPSSFANVKLNQDEYCIRESRDSTDYCRKSAKAVFFEIRLHQAIDKDGVTIFDLPSIDQHEAIIKTFDESTGKTRECAQVDFAKPVGLDLPQGSVAPRFALVVLKVACAQIRVTLETKYHEDWGVFEIGLRLSNTQQTSGMRKSDHQMLLHSVVFPHVYITLSHGQYIIGAQQHAECLEQVRRQQTQLSQQDQLIAELTRQINCVLTRSTVQADTVLLAPFGVYDTVRVDPIRGPELSSVCESIESFISAATLSPNAVRYLRGDARKARYVIAAMRATRRAFTTPHGPLQTLHLYQWKAIQNRIEALATPTAKSTTVIRAPTGAGKTLVFFANAALHFLLTGQRAVMTFPTRILNEDMFKRLTRFVYALREEMRAVDPELADRIHGGILIGTSDPSYKAIVSPIVGQMMVQYSGCPRCEEHGIHRKIICTESGGRPVGMCEDPACGHQIAYMAGPKDVGDVLPALTIATPDKLFYEATLGAPQEALKFFGGPSILCSCGYHISLLRKANQVADVVTCPRCSQRIDRQEAARARGHTVPCEVKSPPLYFVLDEVHSLYGITATLISYFFSLLRQMARSFGVEAEPTFETGTATIANERDLIEALTHQSMAALPDDKQFFDYFELHAERVRYRSLVFMPVGKANRATITNSIVSSCQAAQEQGNIMQSQRTRTDGAYDFLLAYIPLKRNGYIIANELRRSLDDKSIPFLSGDAPTAKLVTLLQEILEGRTNLLLANMVVSLGIDIPRLNNMLMLGIPKSMSEMVQTVGRTGRGRHPGHVVIHLQPSVPRDEFVYRRFHRVMGDVAGYFDRKPVAPVNTYVADLIFINVLHGLLSTKLKDDYRYCFCERSGNWLANGNNARNLLGLLVKEILGRGGTVDLQREIARTIQPRLRDTMLELAGSRGFLRDWARNHPDVLYSLRARADRVPIVVGQTELLEAMRRAAPWKRQMEDSDSADLQSE